MSTNVAVGIGVSKPVATLDISGYMKLAKYSSPPTVCDDAYDGTIALTSRYKICICNGADWNLESDGQTDCWVRDCDGVWSGTANIDNCGVCVGGDTGQAGCVKDCADIWGGTAYEDNCNVCVGGGTGLAECEKDCLGEWNGTATTDDCGVCDNDLINDNSTCTKDCNGV